MTEGSIYTRKVIKAKAGVWLPTVNNADLLFKATCLLELCFIKVEWIQTQEFHKRQGNHVKIFVYFIIISMLQATYLFYA